MMSGNLKVIDPEKAKEDVKLIAGAMDIDKDVINDAIEEYKRLENTLSEEIGRVSNDIRTMERLLEAPQNPDSDASDTNRRYYTEKAAKLNGRLHQLHECEDSMQEIKIKLDKMKAELEKLAEISVNISHKTKSMMDIYIEVKKGG